MVRLKILFVALMMVAPLASNAQHNRNKNKDSKAKGTLFGYWGYNRSAYTKSNIRFVGPDYDFTLNGAAAKDRYLELSIDNYFKIKNITIPQFNARFGYYFKNHWAVSFGYDHLKYVFNDNNKVFLSGEIGPNADPLTGWSGTYNAEPISTHTEYFHYENSDGLNYLRFELTRTDHLIELGYNDRFVLSSNFGAATGALLCFNDFRFGGVNTLKTKSISGYGLSLHANLRAEFLRHFFIQSGFSTGFHHQVKVRTRPNDSSSYARHAYGYSEWNMVFGFLAYIRSKNGCDSCPTW